MVPGKKLKAQQLDVKGAHLNGKLTQPIYMDQPTGFDDGFRLVCLLIKSIYSLKQARHVWNINFDDTMRCHGF